MDIRIEKAKTLLIESDDKVINVALRVGYDDSAFFSRLFEDLLASLPEDIKRKSPFAIFQD